MEDIMKKFKIYEYTVLDINKIRKNLYLEPFLIDELNNKLNSVISIFFPYLSINHKFNTNISVYAQGLDYHIWAKNILIDISKELKKIYFNNIFDIQIDIGNYNEKYFAIKSGLGVRGLNNLVLNNRYGSYGFIGLILTDAFINEKINSQSNCLMCNKCIKSCPGQAIDANFKFNINKCISYITQKKGELSKNEEILLIKSNKIFGCDICQQVCPHNISINYSEFSIINYDFIHDLQLDDIEKLTNKEFYSKYRNCAFSWRGKNILLRNLNIIMKK